MSDPHFRAQARYAFMLGLPPSFTLHSLKKEAERYEQCRFGRAHEAWRCGYFGFPYCYGHEREVQEGHDAARLDLCPKVPPAMSIKAAQRDWSQFEAYLQEVVEQVA